MYLTVSAATKRFGNGFLALDDVSLSVEKGEFFTLLGPSGCGKTTLLRSIAGFNELTSGAIALGGDDLLKVPPHRRDIGMVFQDYAVFPHLTVRENVGFGLKPRKVPAAEARARVDAALASVRLTDLADRLPAAMSGGQQQRIGLARAMAINPRLLLMDEPLSNLDAKLRLELREEIRDIQRQVDVANVYVTHDQEEALAISDRICVMNRGRVEQIGTPQDIYGDPRTLFVAGFVGTLNTFRDGEALRSLLSRAGAREAAGIIVVRPEMLRLAEEVGPSEPSLPGTVRKATYLGREAQVLVSTDAGDLLVHVSNPSKARHRRAGDAVTVAVDPAGLMAFDADGARLA